MAATSATPRLDGRVIRGLTLASLAVHVPSLFRYGYFRDELYFLDCARHLAFGYVDHAPLIAVYARLALLMGGSLAALRVIPMLAATALVALTVLLARRLGGGPFAQLVAGLGALLAPVYLTLGSILTMNVFEPLFWTGCVYVVLRIVQTGDSRLWLLFGLLAGLGLENKHSTLFFGAAVAVGVVATPLRRELAKPWIWLGAGVALVLFLPNLVWQWQHGFPTLEDLRNVRESGKNVVLPPLAFLKQQVMMMHPALAPVWLAGLWAALAGRLRRYRFVGITYLVLLAVFMAMHGKDYYLAPAYPMLLAAGAVAWEAWTALASRAGVRTATRAAFAALLVAAGAVTAPITLPLLDPPSFVAYERWLGVRPQKAEVHHDGPLPQVWGDQFGWPELVADVARIYQALPPEDRAVACIFASNYGEAGAINQLGPAYGLPAAISGHQTHYFWGPRGCTGEVVIVTQSNPDDLRRVFTSVEEAGRHVHPWGMAEENRPIFLCKGLKEPLAKLWPRVKHWN